MRKTKRFAAAVAALALAVSMVAASSTMTAFAADSTVTAAAASATHTFKAYPIFTGKIDGKGISDAALATGVSLEKLNAAAKTAGIITADATDLEAFLTAFSNTTDDKILKKFADALVSAGVGSAATDITAQGVALAEGYYVIVEENNESNTVTPAANILKVVGGTATSIDTKVKTPSVEKKIKENVKTTGTTPASAIDTTNSIYVTGDNDAGDFSIGEAIDFTIFGTLPEDIGDYDKYYYEFTDDLGAGLTLDRSTVSVQIGKVDGDFVAAKDVVVGTPSNGVFTISFNDIKLNNTVDKDTLVKVTYKAALNSNAVIGATGNTNGVKLTYTKDHNYNGEGYGENDEEKKKKETTETPDDGVTAFTYEVDLTKVDGSNSNLKLDGAKFALLNKDNKAALVSDGKLTGWTEDAITDTDAIPTDATYLLETANGGICNIAGLDDGEYTLVEVVAPTSYNKLKQPITIKVDATLDKGSNYTYVADNGSGAFIELATNNPFTVADADAGMVAGADGKVSGTIENSKGVELPETGGIGTTMFYVGGGALAAVAGTVLIAKKRAKKED